MYFEQTIYDWRATRTRMCGLALLLCVGCSSNSDDSTSEPTPQPGTTEMAIAFAAQQEEEAVSNGITKGNSTRAITRATPLSEVKTCFTVWGYKSMSYNEGTGAYSDKQTVFPGYHVDWMSGSATSTTTNSNGWEYILTTHPDQTIKFWDWSAKVYRFFAVTSGTANNTIDGQISFTLNADASSNETIAAAPYFSRLWFSTGNKVEYPNREFGKPVQLEFTRPFARVRFLFTYSYPREGIALTEKSFRPTADVDAAEGDKVKIARKGTVTVHYPTEGTATKEWYTMVVDADKATRLGAFTENYDPDDDGKEYTESVDGWYTVLPANTQGSYTLTVTVNGGDKSCTVPAEYMSWRPGYSYTYAFKITDEGGVEIGWVDYAVTPWIELGGGWSVYNW